MPDLCCEFTITDQYKASARPGQLERQGKVTPTHASSGNIGGGTEHSVVGVQVVDLLTSNRGSDIINGVAGCGEGCVGEGKARLGHR
jgi:hypothetical protein